MKEMVGGGRGRGRKRIEKTKKKGGTKVGGRKGGTRWERRESDTRGRSRERKQKIVKMAEETVCLV